MRNHRVIIGRGFRTGGWVLGAPSLVALLSVCASLFFLRAAPDTSSYLDIGKYGIAGLLANSARGIGQIFGWLGNIGTWFEEVLAIVLLGAVLLAVVLYITGKGLERRSAAARIAAFLLALVFLGLWLVVLLSLPRASMALPGLAVCVSLYVIWVLGWRYA